MFRNTARFLGAMTLIVMIGGSSLTAHAGGEGWTHDYEAAKAQAKKEGKDMLLDFTGSDWCGWCIKLNEEVFSKDTFKNSVPKDFVLVELDFPRDKSKLSQETIDQNNRLKKEFGIRGFPSIYLTDAEGVPYAKTGYQAGGPEKYVAHLKELQENKKTKEEMFAKAKAASGLEKAKLLDAALEATDAEIVDKHHQKDIDEIIALDSDNKAGLKAKYETKKNMKAIDEKMKSKDFQGAVDTATKLIKDSKPEGQLAQDLYFSRSHAYFMLKDKDSAKADLQAALKAQPEGEKAKMIEGVMKRFFPEEKQALLDLLR